ncbi:uncharacterized protein LOC110181387 [Drosophila serrata]|uniref:uncharacterized protein LOC110181387 n=1 Tax=Drosophila serrata TaxID=7274 RepID=UPI000A1D0A4E|nr:uncharacterized protein LOC110181387 [Drosophila serrata]
MTTSTEEAIGTPNSAFQDLEKRLETYMRRAFGFWDNGLDTKNEYDLKQVEYFGILSLTDMRAPQRKLWYMYYATSEQLDKTIDQIHRKYGQRNMYELFRKPVFSGRGMRSRVKNHFSGLRWYVKGNVLEASPNSCYNNEKVVKTVTDLYLTERRKYYDYLNERSALYAKYSNVLQNHV